MSSPVKGLPTLHTYRKVAGRYVPTTVPCLGCFRTRPPDGYILVDYPINHCSFVEHPAECEVSSLLRGKSRGRLTRLNANTKLGCGGRRRTMFQYGSYDIFIAYALRAAPATPSTQKARLNLFICRLLPCNAVV